eukprot:scaffold416985_cov22-Prasinocladus_malaysianus.AAC.1
MTIVRGYYEYEYASLAANMMSGRYGTRTHTVRYRPAAVLPAGTGVALRLSRQNGCREIGVRDYIVYSY